MLIDPVLSWSSFAIAAASSDEFFHNVLIGWAVLAVWSMICDPFVGAVVAVLR